MLKSYKSLVAIASILVNIYGCSSNTKNSLNYEPSRRLRVAVLPFVKVNDVGEIVEDEDGRLLIDNLSLSSFPVNETPTQTIRRILISTLQGTNLNLVSQDLIDVDIPHNGFSLPGNKIDYKKLYSTSAKKLCGSFLDCDAVLFGKLVRWDRSYYGVESVHEVAAELTLVSARDDKVLYDSKGSDFETRGLTKGPTGFSSIVTEPIQGLDSKITENLARTLIQEMLEPLTIKMDKNVDMLLPPPAIFAAAYTSRNTIVSATNPLSILAMASPGSVLSATIQGTEIEIPLFENSPSHYSGKYYPLETDKVDTDKIVLVAKDKNSNETKLKITGDRISTK